jgi:ubiquitin-conjugating enzyme E2 O
MFDEAIVEMSSGTLVRLPELSARLAVGEKGPVRLEAVCCGSSLLLDGRISSRHQSLECRVS